MLVASSGQQDEVQLLVDAAAGMLVSSHHQCFDFLFLFYIKINWWNNAMHQ